MSASSARFLVVAALLAVAGAAVARSDNAEDALQKKALSVAGVQKVIDMLRDMLSTAKREKNDEEVAFAKFGTWCGGEKASLTTEIARNGDTISLLAAEIDKLDSDASTLADEIAALDGTIASRQADIEKATAQRKKDNEDFLAEQADYSETLSALDRAIEMMSKQDYDRPAASAVLLQLSEKERLPRKMQSIIAAFVGMMDTDGDKDPALGGLDYNAPEANAYEFQSGSIITLMKKLKDDFRSKLAECQKEEMNSEHAYDMVKLDLTDTIENSEKTAAEKTALKARKLEMSAGNKKQKAVTEEMKASNEKTLADTTTECSEKDMSYEEKQNLRTEEIEAITTAIGILTSPEVAGNAEKYLALVQQGMAKAAALLQSAGTSAVEQRSQGIRRKVREYLEKEGLRLHSKNLGLLAEKLSTDPFAKVKGIIDAMITRLQEEANADAVHEGYCDTEMGKSKITRTRLSEEIDGLEAAVEDDKSTIMSLKDSTAKLSEEVASLVESMTEATALRKSEKDTNAQTVKDAVAAQSAVEAATAVLKDFYAKALTATALVQGKAKTGMQQRSAALAKGWGLKKTIKMGSDEWNALANPNYGGYSAKADTGVLDGRVDAGHKEGMQTFGAATQGQQDESDYGVIPMLEVIHADFANLEASTKAAEEASQTAYDNFMIESKKNKAMKDRKIEMNNVDQATTEAKLQSDITDLKATQDQLLAADRYHAILVPKCIDKGQTYDERTTSREEEVASLKQALTILNMEDISTSA